MRTSTGLSTEAVYIFNNMLRKLSKTHQPEYIAAVFESGAPTQRMQEFAEYKANRAEAPPDRPSSFPTCAGFWRPCAFPSWSIADSKPMT